MGEDHAGQAVARRLLAQRIRDGQSSAIRDILDVTRAGSVLSLAGGIPAPAMLPVERVKEAASSALDRHGPAALQYSSTIGEAALREAIVRRESDLADPDSLVVTTGSQEGLYLLGRAILDPGDVVVVSEPEYLGALQVFRSYGAELVAVDVDDGGMVVDQLAEQLSGGLRPKLVYVVPNFSNPSGSDLAADRIDLLQALASEHEFLIVSDDPYRELYFDGAAPRRTFDLEDPHVVSLRSWSKSLAPGLRVGALGTQSRWLVEAVVKAKQAVDLHTSTLAQLITTELIHDDAWYDSHLAELRRFYRLQAEAFVAALGEECGDLLSFNTPRGGMFVWCEVAGVGDVGALLPSAIANGVAFVPGEAFAVSKALPRAMRLSYATVAIDEMPEACRRLRITLE